MRERAEAAERGVPEATGALIDHLVARYHERHRAELPGLIALAAEVEHAESGREEVPRGLADLLDGLRAGLEEHMLKEELRVFPLMRGGREDLLAAPLALMREEHEDNALFLLRAEHLTRGYRAPRGSASWDRLYVDLARLRRGSGGACLPRGARAVPAVRGRLRLVGKTQRAAGLKLERRRRPHLRRAKKYHIMIRGSV